MYFKCPVNGALSNTLLLDMLTF